MKALTGFLLFATVFSPVVSQAEERVDELVAKIKAYEELFGRCYIRWEVPGDSMVDGKLVAHETDNPRTVELWANGDRMRHVVRQPGGTVVTRVSDGMQVKSWRGSARGDMPGQGTLDTLNPTTRATFGLERFLRHAGVDSDYEGEIEVLESTSKQVTLRFTSNPESELIATYERFGEYLRTLTYRPYYTDPKTGEKELLTYFNFTYPEWSEPTLDKAGPKTVQQMNDTIGSYVHLDVIEYDFNPEIPEDAFELAFPDGALVVNFATGERWYK